MSTRPSTDFEIDQAAVRTASRRRLLIRMGVMVALVALFGAGVSRWVPDQYITLAGSFALTLMAVYAAVEVSALQWARRSAPTMVLRLGSKGLELWIGSGRHVLPYGDLDITRVDQSAGRVRSIELSNRNGERVVLAGFVRMDELAQALTASIAETRADKGATGSS